MLGEPVRGRWAETAYCGDGRPAACRADLRRSLRDAVTRVTAAQGVSTVGEVGYDKSQDSVRSTTAGTVGVRPIDWQNRPTFQQVVAFDAHRPEGQ